MNFTLSGPNLKENKKRERNKKCRLSNTFELIYESIIRLNKRRIFRGLLWNRNIKKNENYVTMKEEVIWKKENDDKVMILDKATKQEEINKPLQMKR